MQRHIACGQWAVEVLLCSATLPMGNNQGDSCNALRATAVQTPAMHYHSALGNEQCNSCNAPPQCLRA